MRIFHENWTISELETGLHILTWGRVNCDANETNISLVPVLGRWLCVNLFGIVTRWHFWCVLLNNSCGLDICKLSKIITSNPVSRMFIILDLLMKFMSRFWILNRSWTNWLSRNIFFLHFNEISQAVSMNVLEIMRFLKLGARNN